MSEDIYYVYVYIDPRNYEEFYFGKGKADRKNAHLNKDDDTEKTKRIQSIHKEGLSPIIKVIAKGLTEDEAFLVEKTLIWKLGKNLTNISSGHFSDKFRPHNTLHLDLPYFDFNNGIYYLNVGEGKTRNWEDCSKYGFISAGQDSKWSDPLKRLEIGDIVVAYLKLNNQGGGYVGIGKVTDKAKRVNQFLFEGKPLNDYDLKSKNMYINSDNDKSEYLVRVEWVKTVNRKNGKWRKNTGLFTSQQIRVSLQYQPKTISFLESEFEINFNKLLSE